ncbi:hypothetical protein M0R45_000862 [Rubus argutus]|uniref:Uncharacterized protein n=1 Tax=Rubus argutus TaxID=59490 RepID=A0AAW1VJM6_RUBAR
MNGMKQTTWPGRAERCRFTAFPLINAKGGQLHHKSFSKHSNRFSTSSQRTATISRISLKNGDQNRGLSQLPEPQNGVVGVQVVVRSASAGERGHEAADYGSTMAMVDAGLIYWEKGQTDEAFRLYQKAAELGDRNAQCNLGISHLQVEPPNPKEAIKWLYLASFEGHVRAQYQLALCLHHGRGADRNMKEAARWYLRAAEGGYVRAMYNISLCYKFGEGLVQSHRRARKWMKCAADRGHSKAQYEHGLAFFSEGQLLKALLYLELATRAGERAANHIKDVIIQQISVTSCDHVMGFVNNWRALPSSA